MVFSDEQMNLDAIEVALLAGLIAAIGLCAVDAVASDADVVADGYGRRVEDVNRLFVELLEGLAQQPKQGHEQMIESMQSSTQLALAHHMRNVALFLQQLAQ